MSPQARKPTDADPLVRALVASGSVFAVEEASLLREAATGPDDLTERVARRLDGDPLEHIVGWVDFGDLRLRVGPGVFVPRQRSLSLARAAIAAAGGRHAPIVLEAFCGAAPIAASVRDQIPDARVHACDDDPVALIWARANLGPDAGVHESAVLSGVDAELRGRIDVIAAVPPYVPDDALDQLPREARDHEPHHALLGGPDGLDPIRALVREARFWLRPGGTLLIEMNRSQYPLLDTSGYLADSLDDDQTTVVARLRRAEGADAGHAP
ncbi:methyltransferase [Gordonia sp. ABSL1-1]|uniref:N5-glutamine methyltransferase family protein n=1 Tax=Gordonia sp. ABSL1-1 TaxID=3053923 RepID=UPI0025724266|nr:methyltransferase [Gordonia sp. ABSL1-1]MDL9937964.1 methyltransferase [Gordonia sp. ABSL1-1]